jgi:hypothetical protein
MDLNQDNKLDHGDRTIWVHDLMQTWYGDANLNGEFGTDDLVVVLATGVYEDATAGNSGWASGDWDGDSDFTSSDLVVALADGGYEQGPHAAVSTVPEPSAFLLCSLAILVVVSRCRRADVW